MDDVIEALRREAARHQEWVKAQYVMIEILEEAVSRLHVAGFLPQLVRDDSGLSLVLDPDHWTVPAAGAVAKAAAVADDGPFSAALPVAPVAAAAPALCRDDQMIAMRQDGKADREIAALLGVTIRAVEGAFHRMRKAGREVPPAVKARQRLAVTHARMDGTKLHGWTAEAEAQLVDLYGRGLALRQIAAEMGRSEKSVSVQLTRLRHQGKVSVRRHVSPIDGKWPEDRLTELRRLWVHFTPKDIARMMGLSRGAVTGMASRLGLGPSFQPAPKAVEQKSDKEAKTPAPKAVPVATPAPLPEAAAPSGFVGQKGGALTAPGSRPMAFARPVGQVLVGMTQAEKEAAMAAHVAGLPLVAGWDAGLDLELCEAVFGGAKVGVFAAYAEFDPKDCLARFDMIVAPLRLPGHKHLPIEAGPLVLGALRKRVALARAGGVAA